MRKHLKTIIAVLCVGVFAVTLIATQNNNRVVSAMKSLENTPVVLDGSVDGLTCGDKDMSESVPESEKVYYGELPKSLTQNADTVESLNGWILCDTNSSGSDVTIAIAHGNAQFYVDLSFYIEENDDFVAIYHFGKLRSYIFPAYWPGDSGFKRRISLSKPLGDRPIYRGKAGELIITDDGKHIKEIVPSDVQL
jgi:hypothetical protein